MKCFKLDKVGLMGVSRNSMVSNNYSFLSNY